MGSGERELGDGNLGSGRREFGSGRWKLGTGIGQRVMEIEDGRWAAKRCEEEEEEEERVFFFCKKM